ncbi:T9SS type A sorting domain-containing protein [Bacteroidota bacterium]
MEHGNSIRLLDSDMLIDSCIIRFNTQNSSFGSGTISLFRSNPIIKNNKIFRNRRAAIQSGANIASSPLIENNIIFENDVDNYNTPQINFGATGTAPLIIRGNIIRGFYTNAGGIAFLPVGNANVIIENNIITHNRYGIALLGGSNITAIISNNRIDSNNIQGEPNRGGSGINFNGTSQQNTIVKYNLIRNNLWGITIQDHARPNLGNINNADTTDDGLNHIYNNSNSGLIYDLYNNSPDSISAQNNYWGTTILDSVENHIFHKPDNPSLGFVNYIPIYVPTNINGTNLTVTGYKLYDAYPNPFNPTTTIRYELPKGGTVKLILYDMLGREVSKFVNNEFKTAGSYSVVLNGINMSSGLYLYILEVNNGKDFRQVKRMVMIK